MIQNFNKIIQKQNLIIKIRIDKVYFYINLILRNLLTYSIIISFPNFNIKNFLFNNNYIQILKIFSVLFYSVV